MSEEAKIATRILPWIILPRFNNVALSLAVNKERIVISRGVEYYVSTNSRLFIPSASTFIYSPFLRSSVKLVEMDDKTYVNIDDIEGFFSGFLPSGMYVKIPVDKVRSQLETDLSTTPLTGVVTRYNTMLLINSLARLRAGSIFAGIVKSHVEKRFGVEFRLIGEGVVNVITINEKGAKGSFEIRTRFYEMRHGDGNTKVVPGIVPGILYLINQGFRFADNTKAYETVESVLEEMYDVGSRFTSVSLVQTTTRGKFTYVIGELEGDVEKWSRRNLSRVTLRDVGRRAYRGVTSNIVLDFSSEKVLLSIEFDRFAPPAQAVLNYAPLNMTPISAMVNQRLKFLKFQTALARERARSRYGVEATFYIDELSPLGESGITFDDINRAYKEGYIKIDTIRKLLDKMDRVSYIGDISSFAYGDLHKIDEITLASIKPVGKGAGGKAKSKVADEEIVL